MQRLPLRGTLLNTFTVLVGASVGIAGGNALPVTYRTVALTAIGLVTLALGIKMFLETKNVLVPTIAMVVGGMLGVLFGLDTAVASVAEWARAWLGGGGTFNEGLITASVLFCVGPMTILGCLQDGLEHKIELLAIKSTLDLVAATFLAAALGAGVLASAAVVLTVQGVITLLAKPLKPLTARPGIIGEASATGGLILVAIGLNLLSITELHTEIFLLALIVAPLISLVFVKLDPDRNPGHVG